MSYLQTLPLQAPRYRATTSAPDISVKTLAPVKMERLPFSVRVVSTEADLAKAVSIRHAAYARHMPEFAEKLLNPESMDEFFAMGPKR